MYERVCERETETGKQVKGVEGRRTTELRYALGPKKVKIRSRA